MKALLAKSMPAIVGAIFLFSGGYKLIFPGEATYALKALEFSEWLANATIIAVTALELYLGWVLVLKQDLKHSLIAAMVLMFAFTVFLWYLSTLAHPPSCGCMGLTGMFRSTKHAAIFGLFRNCAILWALKLCYDFYFAQEPSHRALEQPAV
jgi:hypothetical protein